MDFLHRPVHYATYAYYSSSFLREHFSTLLKPSFWLNFPLFYMAAWLLLEALLENQITDDSLMQTMGSVMSFLTFAGVILSLWFVPRNHLKLYRDIFSISGLKELLPDYFNFDSLKEMTTNIKYIFSQIFYLGVSVFIFFTSFFISYLTFFIVFSFFILASVVTSSLNFVVLGFLSFFLIYIVLYAISFGLPCFLPLLLTFHLSWGNRGFIARTTSLGISHLKYIILLFALEALVKIFSIIVVIVLVLALSQISWNFQDENIFETLPTLVETSILEEKVYIFLVLAFWGFFNILWDIFKASFISYLFTHYELKDH